MSFFGLVDIIEIDAFRSRDDFATFCHQKFVLTSR